MATINTRKRLEEDLSALKNMIYRMGGMAAESVEQAVWALRTATRSSRRRVIDDGDLIDELEEKVDAGCMEFAARYQPLGEDLRVVVSLMHIAVDLERIGDYGEEHREGGARPFEEAAAQAADRYPAYGRDTQDDALDRDGGARQA